MALIASRPSLLIVRGRLLAARMLLLLAAIVLPLVGFELALRWQPTILGKTFADAALSKYHSRPGGIFYRDPAIMNMRFMVPNFETEMYASGYWWHHKTDALGFRNEAVADPTEVIILGDSFIYGHGVEVDQTVASYLERASGLRVMNLGRQGDSAFEEAYLTSEYVPRLRPRYVVYSFFENDIGDLDTYLSGKEMDRFIREDVANIRYPPRTDLATLLTRRERNAEPPLDRLMLVKAWRFLAFGQIPAARAAEASYDPNDERTIEWRYTKQAIRLMQYVARQNGAELIMAPITVDERTEFEILQRTAREYDIPFVDTWPTLSSRDPALYLPGDGHFSGTGARAMAELIARSIADLGGRRPAR